MARASSVKTAGSRCLGSTSTPSSWWARRTFWMKACPALTSCAECTPAAPRHPGMRARNADTNGPPPESPPDGYRNQRSWRCAVASKPGDGTSAQLPEEVTHQRNGAARLLAMYGGSKRPSNYRRRQIEGSTPCWAARWENGREPIGGAAGCG